MKKQKNQGEEEEIFSVEEDYRDKLRIANMLLI